MRATRFALGFLWLPAFCVPGRLRWRRCGRADGHRVLVRHSLAIENQNTVWAWGLNSAGQLGLGNTTNRLSPVKVPGLSGGFGLGGGVNYSVVLHT